MVLAIHFEVDAGSALSCWSRLAMLRRWLDQSTHTIKKAGQTTYEYGILELILLVFPVIFI